MKSDTVTTENVAELKGRIAELEALVVFHEGFQFGGKVIPPVYQGAFTQGFLAGDHDWHPEHPIARLRKKNGMTQKALAAEIGVHQVDVSRWESNKVKPGIDKLQAIAKALGVNVDDLIPELPSGNEFSSM